MMLVNQVALGNSLDVYKHQRDLTTPPSGYDSVHGVASGEGMESDFKVRKVTPVSYTHLTLPTICSV